MARLLVCPGGCQLEFCSTTGTCAVSKTRRRQQSSALKACLSTHPSFQRLRSGRSFKGTFSRKTWKHKPFQARKPWAHKPPTRLHHPSSPPLSEPDSGERKLWSRGKGAITGSDTSQEVMTEGALFEEYSRGRSREKRRCLATEEDAEDGRGHSGKKQRCLPTKEDAEDDSHM